MHHRGPVIRSDRPQDYWRPRRWTDQVERPADSGHSPPRPDPAKPTPCPKPYGPPNSSPPFLGQSETLPPPQAVCAQGDTAGRVHSGPAQDPARVRLLSGRPSRPGPSCAERHRSEEHTSELQSPKDLVCRLLLE